jgi:hypothetical protein
MANNLTYQYFAIQTHKERVEAYDRMPTLRKFRLKKHLQFLRCRYSVARKDA